MDGDGHMEVRKASSEQLMAEMGPAPWSQAQQQAAAALVATGHIRLGKSLGQGAFGQVYQCIIEAAASVPGSMAASFKAAAKVIPYNLLAITSSSSSTAIVTEDTSTPLQVVHEVVANQAVSNCSWFATLLGCRMCAAGAVLIFQLVGSGITLGQAVALPGAEEGGKKRGAQTASTSSSSASPAAAVAAAGPLPPLLNDHLLRFLVSTSNQLHKKGIINLDVKPANVLHNSQGQPCMADLGTAVPRGMVVSGVGSPLFCAPQVREGAGWGSRVEGVARGYDACQLLGWV